MAEFIQGLDISHHQGDVNFTEVAQAGFRFCVCKATEGEDYEDPRFRENMKKVAELRTTDASFYPGAYHFARPDHHPGRSGGELEGRWFSKVLRETAAECGFSVARNFLQPALDFETYCDCTGTQNIPWIEGFLAVVQGETGRSVMLYTGPNIWKSEVSDTAQFVDRTLWEVKYNAKGSDPSAQPPQMPNSGPAWEWTLWQWSGGGEFAYYHQQFGDIPGIPGGVADVSRLNGGDPQLRELANRRGFPSRPTTDVTWPRPPQQVDLETLRGSYSDYVARVQALLLAHGYGPDGLIGPSGFPDGLMGSKTESYLEDFKSQHQLAANTVVDWDTWWVLAYDQLRT